MSHEFLTSLHSHVIETSKESKVGKFAPKQEASVAGEKSPETNAIGVGVESELNRTVGVSMSPKLRARAAARAREVGLSFSRYVQWCLEAELDGSTLGARFHKPNG